MKKMVQSIFGRVLFAALAFSVVLSSCNNNDDNTPVPANTIVDVAVGNPNLTFLVAAIQRASTGDVDVAGLLSDPDGEFTVFAPTNAAFIAAGYENIAAIQAEDPDVLLAVLSYHVLTSEVRAAQVPAGPNAAVETLADINVFATRNSNGVFINGVRVAQADVLASNGVVHVIGSVLLPPVGNIVETASEVEDLSTLVAAIQYVDNNLPDANIAEALSGAGPLTVFAPTNAAFQTLLSDVGAAGFSDVDPEVVRDILLRHVVSGRVFSSDLTNGASVPTLLTPNGNVTIGVTANGATVIGGGDTASNIIVTNIVTTNGVVHVIDRVIRLNPAPVAVPGRNN